jgi:Mg-chelatase subunit ChlD
MSGGGGTGMESSPRSTGHGRSRRSRSGGSSSSSSGHTLFTAECSQQFRSPGVVPKKTSLRELLAIRSTNLSQPPPLSSSPQPFFRPLEPRVFDDDDPVERTPRPLRDEERVGASAEASSGRSVAIATHCEYSALARDSSADDFALLVHVRAPGTTWAGGSAAPRAPLDLVTVLDVSGSMVGTKLALLKQAMGFVIDNLGPRDRLCVISFSSGASRLMRLARMSDAGKALARRAVGSLAAGGGTNIGEALRRAARVLDECGHRNAVASVVLLSDGQDTYTVPSRRGRDANYDALVPPSFACTSAGRGTAPVHTLGLGTDHDAAAMHTVAEATGGTFSFVENEADMLDAFAQCVGGLLSVAVQGLRVDVACAHPGVRVAAVRSGRYESRVDVDGRAASIDVGELYADEERRLLLFLHVPRARAAGDEDTVMRLVEVDCSYRDTATGRAKNVAGEDAVVRRPSSVATTVERSAEVDRERVRVKATDGIASARAAAERGAHAEAVEILRRRQRAVARSAAAREGDPMCAALSRELQEMRARVADRRRYELSGRAYVLAGLSAHAQQRATSRQMTTTTVLSGGETRGRESAEYSLALATAGGTTSYMTPAMLDMLDRSREHRQLQTIERGRTF